MFQSNERKGSLGVFIYLVLLLSGILGGFNVHGGEEDMDVSDSSEMAIEEGSGQEDVTLLDDGAMVNEGDAGMDQSAEEN